MRDEATEARLAQSERQRCSNAAPVTIPANVMKGCHVMILVVGATGALGRRIADMLRQADRPVRALYRDVSDPATFDALRASGVECHKGDLRDPASLAAACRDVEVVVSTATAIARPDDSLDAVDLAGQLQLIEAAENAGVQRFVFVSFALPDGAQTDFPMAVAKRTAEQRLRNSGLEYTILQPTPFMETWLSPIGGFDYSQGAVRLVGDGNNRISFVATEDVARCAVAAVQHPGATNRELAVGGPTAPSWNDVVSRFEAATGRPFTVERVPPESLQAQVSHVPDPKGKSFLCLSLATARDWIADAKETAAALDLPLSSWISVDDYVRRATGAA